MIELFVVIAKFFLVASLVVVVFWIVQIRFGTTDDLDESSKIVRAIRRKRIESEARTNPQTETKLIVSDISGFAAPPELYPAITGAIIYQRASEASFFKADLKKSYRLGKRPQKEDHDEAVAKDYRYPDAQTRLIEHIEPLTSKYVH